MLEGIPPSYPGTPPTLFLFVARMQAAPAAQHHWLLRCRRHLCYSNRVGLGSEHV